MRSSFFEFNVALSGMNTARQGTRVASHNMSNLTTPGFSRQVIAQRASTPLATNSRVGMIGTGSEVIGINQIRDLQLDTRFWNESPVHGLHNVRNNQLTMIEMAFGELNGLGPTANFEQFFSALQDFHLNPNSPTHRNNVISSINTLTRSMQERGMSLIRQQQDVNREISGMVSVINSLGQQITTLNENIARYEQRGGQAANDLRDRRALLIDELSQLVNITVSENNVNGVDRLNIHIDGQYFLSHGHVQPLTLVRRETPLHPHDSPGLYDIRIGDDHFRTDSRTLSGELRALFEIRDGSSIRDASGNLVNSSNHASYGFQGIQFKGIPYYISRLNNMIQTISNAFNFGVDRLGNPLPDLGATHTLPPPGIPLIDPNTGIQKVDANGNDMYITVVGGHLRGHTADNRNPNIPLFVPDAWNPSSPMTADDYARLANGINIFNFSLNPAILADPALFSTALNSHTDGGVDERNLLEGFLNIRNHPQLFREGTINDFLNSVMAELAMDIKDAYAFSESQGDIIEIIHNQRLQVKGVDMQEEMITMLFFQQQFQAASRMISAINEMYDNLINRMGA